MTVALDVAFHNIAHSEQVDEEIRAHVERLEHIYNRLIACRVRVDQRAQNVTKTTPPTVRIELSVPGHNEIVIAHEPDHLQLKFQRPDLHRAISEAFRIAARRLAAYKDRLIAGR